MKGTHLKGEVGIEHDATEGMNPDVGFKHMRYEVAESNHHVTITIVKKTDAEITVGIRTVEVQALAGKDFTAKDEMICLKAKETERDIKIEIKNDAEWEPDKDFKVELIGSDYKRLEGKDTECTVTILDDERPGILGFEQRFVNVRRKDQSAFVKIVRSNGSDGTISCSLST